MDIASKEADIRNSESTITEYSSKSTAVKVITLADVDATYNKVKDALEALLKFNSFDDPMYARIQELIKDVKNNKDNILNSLN
jgi:hypothetical protein